MVGPEAGDNAWRVSSYYSRHRPGMEVEEEVQGAVLKRQAAVCPGGTEQKAEEESKTGTWSLGYWCCCGAGTWWNLLSWTRNN